MASRYRSLVRVDLALEAAETLRPIYDSVQWPATPLGPLDSWSPALRGAVDLALHARFPVTLLWGPELVLLYNEAFVPLIADKHPTALGRRASEVFPEAWGAIGPMLRGVLAGRGATWVEDELVPLRRHGLMEEAYFTFSYSPVRSEHGAIEGVMDIATETTDQVLDRRRQRLLGRLGKRVGDAEDVEHLTRRAASLLREDPRDLRACDIRLGGAPAVVRDARLPERPATPLGHRDVLVEERPAGRVAWVPLTSTRATSPESVLCWSSSSASTSRRTRPTCASCARSPARSGRR